jgi:hypothetical protein
MVLSSQLPKPTLVNRVIPKNAFDSYCTHQQRRLFTEKIEKIRWTNKLAWETINLPGNEIKEIQCFEIELRQKDGIEEALRIIDRAIPYPILFKLTLVDLRKWVISKKHPNPTNEDNAVIDWTFESEWSSEAQDISFELKISLDEVFKGICLAVAGDGDNAAINIGDLVRLKQETKELNSKIDKLKAHLAREKQFNRKVELNLELQVLQNQLNELFKK